MKPTIRRLRAPRTLRGTVVRVLLPRAAVFAMVVLVLFLGRATAAPSAAPIETLAPENPVWSMADRAAEPDCVPSADWPAGALAAEVVVHRYSDDTVLRLPFDRAWAINHDASEANDLWVLGVCR